MKILIALILLALLSTLSGCATTQQTLNTLAKSADNVRSQHTDEEWATWYDVNQTVFGEAEERARTSTGKKLFGALKDGSASREAALRD